VCVDIDLCRSDKICSLSEEEMVFNPYTVEQLQKILADRVKLAFNDDAVSGAAINLCAAMAGKENGDARKAIDLLRVAADGNVYVTNFNSNQAPGNTVSVISTTLTSTQAIQKLINTIDSFHLPKGVTTSLEAPLNAALAQLNRNNPTPACNQLNAFLNQVNAKQTSGQLTPQQGTDLIQQAVSIQHALGCTNIGGMVGASASPSLLPLPMP
jgi:hypothetical protein